MTSSALPARPWRLLRTDPASGPWNMAVDEAVMLYCARGEAPPTLRLYGWEPRCLSVGCFQRVSGAILTRCSKLGIDWVRRPTGGRAVLHDAELTYSLALPEAEPCVTGSVRESYRRLSQALVSALRRLGISAAVAEPHRRRERQARSDACFDATSFCEITVHGKKLIGSAQVRRGGAVLQHGSILLRADWEMMATLFGHNGLRHQATTASEALGRDVSWEEMADALASHCCVRPTGRTRIETPFEAALGIQLEDGELTSEETVMAEQLVEKKYSSPEWNLRR